MKNKLPKAHNYLAYLNRRVTDPELPRYSVQWTLELVKDKLRSIDDQDEWQEGLKKSFEKFYLDLESAQDSIPDVRWVVDNQQMEERKQQFDSIIDSSFDKFKPYHTSSNVYYGTIETSSLNAMILPVPDSDEFLVLFNRGLWKFMEVISYLVASSIPFYEELAPLAPTESKNSAFGENADLFESAVKFILQSPCAISYPRELVKFERRRWDDVHNAIDDFVFGHEYAHFLHEHFTHAHISSSWAAVIGKIEYTSCATSWGMEYEADKTGLDLAVFRNKDRFLTFYTKCYKDNRDVKETPDFSDQEFEDMLAWEGIMEGVEGALLFLHSLCQVERIKSVIFSPDSSHPPTWLRIHHIHSVLKSETNDQGYTVSIQRLYPYVNCILEYFQRVRIPSYLINNPFCTAERAIQDMAFQSVLRNSHDSVIQELMSTKQYLLQRGTTPTPSAEPNELSLELIKIILTLIKQADITVAECCRMLDNCIAVLEMNINIIRKTYEHGYVKREKNDH